MTAKRLVRKLPSNLAERIQIYCRENKITPAVIFEMALNIYLFKINPNNQAITTGIPVLNRTKKHEKNIAGMFITTVPLTINISENDSINQLEKRITKEHINTFRHQRYPYSMILKNLREKQDFEGNLYDVMISFQNANMDIDSTTKWYSNGFSEVPFVLHIDNRDNGNTYTLTVDYQVAIFRQEKEVNNIIDRLEYILNQITMDSMVLVKDISIIPYEERHKILVEFNETKVDYPREKCVHELFMEQAAKASEETAVVYEDKKITYKELDEMSNVLAHLLREKGVGRGDIVPIIAKRSLHILVAMFGILKAGAGYMPIASDYPKDRVQFIVKEAKSRVGCILGYEEQLDGIELLKLDELGLEEAEEEKKRRREEASCG